MSDQYDKVEQAENKATEQFNKVLHEYSRLAETIHDVRRNLNFITSDIWKEMEDTPDNNLVYSVLQNANSSVTDNSTLHDMTTIVRDIAYCMKVKARHKAREQIKND